MYTGTLVWAIFYGFVDIALVILSIFMAQNMGMDAERLEQKSYHRFFKPVNGLLAERHAEMDLRHQQYARGVLERRTVSSWLKYELIGVLELGSPVYLPSYLLL